jgi:hypothetical protein
MQPETVAPLQDHPYYNLFLLRENNAAISNTRLSPQERSRGAGSGERIRFALFLKILYKNLKDSGDVALFLKAQRLLLFVTSKNRAGDPSYTPLMVSLEKRLRSMVGEAHWRRSHLLMSIYLSRKSHVPTFSTGIFHKLSYAA